MSDRTILVITIGGSRGPLIKSIEKHCPDFICFLPSVTSTKEIEPILEEVYPDGFDACQIFAIENHDDIISCYRQCCLAFDRAREEAGDGKIIADLTGGTKVMSAALILASADQGLEISYVSGEREKAGLGVVKNGTEQIVYSAHPFDLIARKQKERFCDFFNSCRFSAAADACDDISRNGSEVLGRTFAALKKISAGYKYWDLFRLNTALSEIRSGLNNLSRLSEEYPGKLRSLAKFQEDVTHNLERLEAIQQIKDHSLAKVDDLTANACRRAEEGKFDDGIARLYRALEMIAQWRFCLLFDHDTSKFPLDKLREKLDAGVISTLFPQPYSDDTIDIGCKKAFEVLDAAGDDYGRRYMQSINDIGAMLYSRNHSILAHGTEPRDKKHFSKAYDIFVETFGIRGDVRFPEINPDDLAPLGLD